MNVSMFNIEENWGMSKVSMPLNDTHIVGMGDHYTYRKKDMVKYLDPSVGMGVAL